MICRPSTAAIAKTIQPRTSGQRFTETNRTTGATDGPKSLAAFVSHLRRQLAADRLAAAAGVDPRFALALWTLTFGPLAVETSVPSDASHPWPWSLSVLVTVGAGWCEKPVNQPKEPTLDKRASSIMKATRAARFAFFPKIDTSIDPQQQCASKKRKVGGTNHM